MVKLAKTPLGFFAVEGANQLVDVEELPRKPGKAAEALTDGSFDKWRKELGKKGVDIEEGLFDPLEAAKLLGVGRKEYLEFARKVGIEIAKKELKDTIGKDFLVIQAVGGLDDLNKSINIMMNRLHEWFGLHYPELQEEDHQKYLKAIAKGKRGESMGMDLRKKDLKVIRDLAETVQEMYDSQEKLEKYLEVVMGEIAPNVTEIAGASLGARLIHKAGSLRSLALMPSSTVQVLGAEKALFKHLRKGTPPPKHGVIFQHPAISRSPRKDRGRMARALAGKIVLGARADLYAGEKRPSIIKDWKERKKEVLS